MNVIFLDFDGTLVGLSDKESMLDGKTIYSPNVEKRIAILATICKKYDCKVVISSGCKNAIDEETLEVDPDAKWINYLFGLFNKYGIEVIGRTPNVRLITGKCTYHSSWKEFEILKWLFNHPEVEHYCVLDDNDTVRLFHWDRSDLERVKDHLVMPDYLSDKGSEYEGLQEHHIEEVGRVLQLENEVQKLALRRKRRRINYAE